MGCSPQSEFKGSTNARQRPPEAWPRKALELAAPHSLALEAATGHQVWLTNSVTSLKNGASVHLTPNGDSVLLFTDQGNLIRARLSSAGYQELSRVHLLDATHLYNGRNVAWPPPACANRHVFARSDQELVCASLAAIP
jgi:hypothetical protein